MANPINKTDKVMSVTIEVESDDDVLSESSEDVTNIASRSDSSRHGSITSDLGNSISN